VIVLPGGHHATFNVLIFEGWIPGAVEVFSNAEFNEPLGRADSLRFQVNVTDGTGTTPVLTAKYYHSNNNIEFEPNNTLHNAAITQYPSTVFGGNNTAIANAGNGRVGFVTENGKKLYARCWAVGRSN
jgi:hypothetical protein